ncbi:MAG: metallopeptidase family protein [Elusimicrobiota bacterium]
MTGGKRSPAGPRRRRGPSPGARVSREEFLRLAERAFAEIPPSFRDSLVNVELAVRAAPGPEAGRWRGSRDLLGLYEGPTREEMLYPDAGAHLPARVVLYQRNIEAACRTRPELIGEIRTTLRHELAHHFGFSDEDLRERWPEGA